MECLERRVKNLERRVGDRRVSKRTFIIQKIILLLITTAAIGAAHMLGWKAQQDIRIMKEELVSISRMQKELYENDSSLYIERTWPYKINYCIPNNKCLYWETYLIDPKMQP